MQKKDIDDAILIAGKRLTKIAYSDKPLPQGADITYLSIEQFEQRFGFTYSESLHGSKARVEPYLRLPINSDVQISKSITAKTVEERLNNPLDCLVVCNMGLVGHGLFTMRDLPKNTLLFIYSGVVQEASTDDKEGEYDYAWVGAPAMPIQAICAKYQGGLARFMQHLPVDFGKLKRDLRADLVGRISPELLALRGVDLDQYCEEVYGPSEHSNPEFNDLIFRNNAIKEMIQTVNIVMSTMVYKGIPLLICWNETEIKANEQIGTCYGSTYWKAPGRKPHYFKLDGSLVDLYDYQISSKPHLFNSNPLTSYQEGIKLQNEGKFMLALNAFSQALTLFSKKVGENSLECGNCYSALTSSYRDLKNYQNAIHVAEEAIKIFNQIGDKERLKQATSKYHQCLTLAQLKPQALYQMATTHFKEKNNCISIAQLEYLLSQEKLDPNLRAYCHSTLASAYRDLGDYPVAADHCKQAMELRKQQRDAKGIEVVEKKLHDILKLQEANQPASMSKHGK